LIAAVPYRLHTVLTDNGIQFADLPKNRDGKGSVGLLTAIAAPTLS